MLFFISPPYCCFPSSESNNTLLYQNEGEETQSQKHQHSCHVLLELRHSSLPFWKNHKKTWGQACETITLIEVVAYSSCRCSKQLVFHLLTVNWFEHFIRWGYIQICSGNNNTSLLCGKVKHRLRVTRYKFKFGFHLRHHLLPHT